jgi:hypothetical protein
LAVGIGRKGPSGVRATGRRGGKRLARRRGQN